MYIKINHDSEIRKFLAGKPTKVAPALLLFAVGPRYLTLARKDKKGE
jgi:hypothetical protein